MCWKSSATLSFIIIIAWNYPGYNILYHRGQMTVIWESLCVLLSLQIRQEFNHQTPTYHYPVVQQRLYMYKDLHCSDAGLFATESRQPDMVANKIKSTTTPVGFHGHIRHQSLMSRVSGAILSAGLLWSLPHTPRQNRPLHQYFSGRALTGHEVAIARREKKISSSRNTAGGLF